MNEWTMVVIAVLVGACAIPVGVVAWAVLVANKRISDHNRDLLKSVLALSEKPAGMQLAGALEATDRANAQVTPNPARPVPQGYAPPHARQVGA